MGHLRVSDVLHWVLLLLSLAQLAWAFRGTLAWVASRAIRWAPARIRPALMVVSQCLGTAAGVRLYGAAQRLRAGGQALARSKALRIRPATGTLTQPKCS